jgi:uncharacterized protein
MVAKLGVGLSYQAPMRPFIMRALGDLDFLEVIPDILWTDRGHGRAPRYVDDPDGVAFLNRVRAHIPVIAHGIGLSIGSAHRFDHDHVEQVARWHNWLGFPWHSEHLAYSRAELDESEVNVGVTLPLPLDEETLELLIPRVNYVLDRIPVPFLLENNVSYFELEGQGLDEPSFMNELCRRSGCQLLLDLHNLYTNSRNHGYDPLTFLERLELQNVTEVHVAGGLEHGGFYLDAHSGPIPHPVWELLDWTLPRCPNLGGVTFELLGSWFEPMGEERLASELERLKAVWSRHQLLTDEATN